VKLYVGVAFGAGCLLSACGEDAAQGPSSGTGGEGVASSSSSTGTTTGSGGASGSTGGGGQLPVVLPPANAVFDYQLGGAYSPPSDVTMVVRDRAASPGSGLYNVCYVNGFQAQPGESQWWLDNHPELVLRDGQGDPIIDADWNELLLDTKERDGLLAVIAPQVEQCATDGYDAVEVDNLDSHLRGEGQLAQADNVAFMAELSKVAHAAGLAIAQKNAAELLDRHLDLGTDFVVSEECNRYDECQDFVDAYGDVVFIIEYCKQGFDQGCTSFSQLSIVLRDLDLVTPQSGGHVFDEC